MHLLILKSFAEKVAGSVYYRAQALDNAGFDDAAIYNPRNKKLRKIPGVREGLRAKATGATSAVHTGEHTWTSPNDSSNNSSVGHNKKTGRYSVYVGSKDRDNRGRMSGSVFSVSEKHIPSVEELENIAKAHGRHVHKEALNEGLNMVKRHIRKRKIIRVSKGVGAGLGLAGLGYAAYRHRRKKHLSKG